FRARLPKESLAIAGIIVRGRDQNWDLTSRWVSLEKLGNRATVNPLALVLAVRQRDVENDKVDLSCACEAKDFVHVLGGDPGRGKRQCACSRMWREYWPLSLSQ